MTWLEQEWFHIDPLAISVGLCITVFTVLTLLYSWAYMPKGKGIGYNLYILLTFGTALAAVFANNLITLLVCWGLTGVFLYLLIGYGTKARTPTTAKKAFIVIGGTDAFMMLGVAIIGTLGGTFNIQHIRLNLDEPQAALAFICLLVGILAKAGSIPLHTWLVDTAEDAPTPVTAFLPASVDKLLGIYLLARMALNLFVMRPAMYSLLLIIGTVTIVGAGLMMLAQQDFKRLLGYCAVSQVGYVLVGIGTGHPLGIAGGLFHMVNHAIYKSCLFFSGGAVEQRTHTTDIERLGGLAKSMPVIFVTFLLAALSVSGVPPLNGFASKWMIYQAIIETAKAGGAAWILWLVAAMFGSALTLAGLMKLVHAIFLGQPSPDRPNTTQQVKATSLAISLPPIFLAALCIIFGIWAYAVPLRHLIFPILDAEPDFPGLWQPTLATVLILIGIGLGLIIYISGQLAKRMRKTDVFIGGETLDTVPGMRISGRTFYDSIQDLPLFRSFFVFAEKGSFDPYEIGNKAAWNLYRILGDLHNGILSTYVSWSLVGIGVLFFVLFFG